MASVLLLCSGCVDGYPRHHAVDVPPGDMTQAQRIEAMNQLGKESNPDGPWHYNLLPHCTLEVMARRSGKPRLSSKLPVRDAIIAVDFDREDETFEVRVRPQEGLNQLGVSVLDSPRWIDAVVMRSLLDRVRQGCSQRAPASEQRPTAGRSRDVMQALRQALG